MNLDIFRMICLFNMGNGIIKETITVINALCISGNKVAMDNRVNKQYENM